MGAKGHLQSYKETPTKEPNGTYIEFKLDKTIMTEPVPPMDMIINQIQEFSFLVSGITFKLNDNIYYSKEGLKDLIKTKVSEPITSIFI